MVRWGKILAFALLAAVFSCELPIARPTDAVDAVMVSPASANVQVGGTAQFTAIALDAAGNSMTGRVVTWTGANVSVANVNSSGLVTAVVAGSATILAASEGKSGSASVTVTTGSPPPPPPPPRPPPPPPAPPPPPPPPTAPTPRPPAPPPHRQPQP